MRALLDPAPGAVWEETKAAGDGVVHAYGGDPVEEIDHWSEGAGFEENRQVKFTKT
jgi:hypothetical protein